MNKERKGRLEVSTDFIIPPQFEPYVSNLSLRAADPEGMPFIGREREREAVMETLLRRLKNNVILVGRPGVGKTAFITSLAARLGEEETPEPLRGKTVLELSVNTFFHAQQSYETLLREFEALVSEIRKNGRRVILFLDELVVRLMTSGQRRQNVIHIQNLLKNSIARKEFTVIAATTPEDYYRFIKNDDFLGANANTIFMEEPDQQEMMKILAGIAPYFSRYYRLKIPESLFGLIYRLARRFIPHRAFPDKVVELLDGAAAKAALKKASKLDVDHIYQSVAEITRLPGEVIRRDPAKLYEGLLPYLSSRVINQEQALIEITRVLKLSYLQQADDRQRPQAILLFLGPPGIGKSFVARRIAEYFFAAADKLRTIDLSEFNRAEDVEKLLNDPSGSGEGALLAAIEAHPFSVLLLENVQEAHSAVLYFIGEALKRGEIIDRSGGRHALSRTIVILSLTRIGVEQKEQTIGFISGGRSKPQVLIPAKIMNLLDWVDEIIEFTPLEQDQLIMLAEDMLRELSAVFSSRHRVRLKWSDELISLIARLAGASGRYAHALHDFIERKVKTALIDALNVHGQNIELSFSVHEGELRIAVKPWKKGGKTTHSSGKKTGGDPEE